MLTRSVDGSQFVVGAAHYNDTPESTNSSKIILQVRIGGLLTYAFVHTDSTYVICHPDVAEHIALNDPIDDEEKEVRISGQLIRGLVYKIDVEFLADEDKGNSLSIEAFVFVVDRNVNLFVDELPLSSIGFGGCLESMCFAVEGNRRLFYFG